MPYIEKTGVSKIKEQLWQWDGVMHDPNIDGFNGWGCKQKIYEVLFAAQEYIDKAPTYHGEDEWLEERKTSLESMMYWDEYKKHLESQGLSKYVLSSIDNATDRILKRCCDPKDSNIISRRGMVVGSVQSGKTANYIGLLTKAADYGYKIIIIIAGINETLRQQTQYRVNEGFVSEDMSRFKSIGIHLIQSDLSNKTKSKTIKNPTSSLEELEKNVEQLLREALEDQKLPIRRVGVKVSDLSDLREQSSLTNYF